MNTEQKHRKLNFNDSILIQMDDDVFYITIRELWALLATQVKSGGGNIPDNVELREDGN